MRGILFLTRSNTVFVPQLYIDLHRLIAVKCYATLQRWLLRLLRDPPGGGEPGPGAPHIHRKQHTHRHKNLDKYLRFNNNNNNKNLITHNKLINYAQHGEKINVGDY